MYQDKADMRMEDQAGASSDRGLMRTIDLRDLWAPIYRSRWPVVAIFVAVFSLAIIATLLIQPRYRATATVEIKAETQKVLGTEDRTESAQSPADASTFLDTQLEIIKSRATTQAVAQSLGLYSNDAFLTKMSIKSSNDDIGRDPEAYRKLVDRVLISHLKVVLTDETRIAQINFSSPDAHLAQQIANSYAENYIRLNLTRRFDASSYSLDFLRDQIREAQARLGNSERQAIEYARNARLIDASNAASNGGVSSSPQSLTTASLVGLNQARSDAVAKRIATEERWRVAESTPLMSIPEVVANPTVQQLQQQIATQQAQYQDELQTRTTDYPAVRQLDAKVRELKQQLAVAANNVKSTIRGEYETARRQEAGLSSNIETLKSTTLNEQSRSIRLSILRREADTNRQQLDALLKRYNDLNAQSGVQLNNLAVIDHADVPDAPYWPSPALNVALALVLSILLSGGYVVSRENLFDVVRTPEDVATRLRLPMLGAVPVESNVITAMNDPKSGVSESLNSIRTSLALSSGGGFPKSFMLTSTQAGEGKSTVSYGLARSLAKLGHSVVLVDADLRRPNIHHLLGVGNAVGMSNILSGGVSVDDVLLRDLEPKIDAIVAGPIPPDSAELLASNRLQAVIMDLVSRYDHVVVDSAPVLGLADAPLIATSVEGIVFVVETARTSIRGAQTAATRIQQSGTPLLGAILSRFDAKQAGYSYEYRYAYEYSYGSPKT